MGGCDERTSVRRSDVPVLIAGGGLIGLSTAMFLAQHGISSLAVERLRGGSQLPRAAFFHMRTLEMFRSAGIEDEVREQSRKEFEPEGALIIMDTLAGKKLADIIPSLNEGVDALSPCRRLFVTQPGLEPILRRRAEAAGAKVLDGYEVVGVEQDADGVTLTVQDVESGKKTSCAGNICSAPTARTAGCASSSTFRSTDAACSRTASPSTSMPISPRSSWASS